jgi:hypothetical protein
VGCVGLGWAGLDAGLIGVCFLFGIVMAVLGWVVTQNIIDISSAVVIIKPPWCSRLFLTTYSLSLPVPFCEGPK